MRVRCKAVLSLLFVLPFAPAVHAQSGPAPAARDTAVYEQPPVQVSAPRPRATPGGSSAVEAALDSGRVRPAPTLEQVLREMPLVVVRANSRGEAQPALRGGEDRQIAVLVDGVPITLAWDARTDLSVVPLTGARDLVVHRGLSSLLSGPNALGGAVEVDVAGGRRAATAPPPLVLDAGVDHTGARSAALTAGTLRRDARGLWLLRAGGGYRGSDGFALAHGLDRADPATRARLTDDGDLRLNSDVEAFDGFVALRREGRGGAWASFTGAGYRLERGVAPEAHTSDPRLWRYPFQARGIGALSGGTGMRTTPWGRGDLEASIGADVGRMEISEYDALDYRTVAGTEDGNDRTYTGRLVGDHTLGERGDLRAALTFADVSHDEILDDGPTAEYRQRLWSLAGETDWRADAGVPLRLSIGAAADGADTPESSDKPALERLWDWGGRAGATAVLHGGRVLVHGAASRRARFPALRELYSGALGRFLPNPDLRAEAQWVSELGLTMRHVRGELQVVGFHQVLEDGIARVSVVTPGGNRFQRVNQGRVTADGLELLGDLTLGRLAFGGDLTVQDVRLLDASGGDTDPEYEPAVHGGAWCEAPLPAAVRLGLALHGTGEQRYFDLDSGSLATLAPSARLDVRLARGFELGASGPWRRVDAVLAVENVIDQSLFDQAGLPQPGRTIRVQARVW
jgi:iron complex outermembrane receptor protein